MQDPLPVPAAPSAAVICKFYPKVSGEDFSSCANQCISKGYDAFQEHVWKYATSAAQVADRR